MNHNRNQLLKTGLNKLLKIKDSDIRITTLKQGYEAVDHGIHMGGAFSAIVPLVSVFYGGFINLDIADPTSLGQDIFVLSKGHAVATMASVYADLGYFESLVPRPDFTRSTSFNWIPQPARSADVRGAITATAEPLAHTILGDVQLDQDPGIMLYDMQEEIRCVVHFPRERFSAASMEQFAQAFVRVLELMQEQPELRLNEVTIRAAS